MKAVDCLQNNAIFLEMHTVSHTDLKVLISWKDITIPIRNIPVSFMNKTNCKFFWFFKFSSSHFNKIETLKL